MAEMFIALVVGLSLVMLFGNMGRRRKPKAPTPTVAPRTVATLPQPGEPRKQPPEVRRRPAPAPKTRRTDDADDGLPLYPVSDGLFRGSDDDAPTRSHGNWDGSSSSFGGSGSWGGDSGSSSSDSGSSSSD